MNAVDMLLFAELYSAEILKEAVMIFIVKNKAHTTDGIYLQKVPVPLLHEIITALGKQA